MKNTTKNMTTHTMTNTMTNTATNLPIKASTHMASNIAANAGLRKQRGASLIGILFFGGLLVFLGIIGAQVVPTYLEFQTIGKAVEKAKGASTAAEARSTFDKVAQVDDIKSITSKDLVFTPAGNKFVISYAYTKEIHVAGPAYLLMKYAGRTN